MTELVPTKATDIELLTSTMMTVTVTLKEAILQQDFQYTGEAIAHQLEAKAEIHRGESRRDRPSVQKCLPHPLKWTMGFAQEKGASSWLMPLPID